MGKCGNISKKNRIFIYPEDSTSNRSRGPKKNSDNFYQSGNSGLKQYGFD